MPDIITRAFQDVPLVYELYSWEVFLGFLIAVVATGWIFIRAHDNDDTATEWKALAGVATVLALPALLARLDGGIAADLNDALELVAYLNVVAGLLALAAAGAYLALGDERSLRTTSAVPPSAEAMSKRPTGSAPGRRPEQATRGTFSPAIRRPAGRLEQNHRVDGVDSDPVLAFLVVQGESHTVNPLPIGSKVTRIGRDSRWADYVIEDEAVSAIHLSIRLEDDTFILTDLDTENGTTVNGKRVARHLLATRDVIVIGRTTLVFMQVPKGED